MQFCHMQKRRTMKKYLLCLIVIVVINISSGFAEIINSPAEKVYESTLNYLLDLGAVPVVHDKELLIIKTEPLPSKLTSEECDCGSMFGIPYMKDKRTKTAVTYQIRVKKNDEATSDLDVRVNIDGYMDVADSPLLFMMDKHRDSNKVLNCKSKGILEQKFTEEIKNKLR